MFPIHFAPLQGFTESAYRLAHYRFAPGIDTYYTPFLRIEKGNVREKDLRDLETDLRFIAETLDGASTDKQGTNSKRKPYHLIPQIIARDRAEFEILTKTVTGLGFTEIDINMGCPYPMQAKSGRGSGLLARPEKVREILDAINQFSSEKHIQFSIKMRIGYSEPNESLQLLPMLNDTSLAHITLHPRLGIQQYKGALDFNTFDQFYTDCKHPLLFNGDLANLQQIKYIETRYPKLSGIMIGRGLLANPVLAAQYAGIPCETPIDTLLKIHTEMLADYTGRLQGSAQILNKIRPFWTYTEIPKKIQKKIEKSRNLAEYLEAVNELS